MKKDRDHRSLQAVSRYYTITAVLLCAGHSVFGNAGALELIWPRLPNPIAPHVGRAVHLNLAIHWPLIGLMGLSYYLSHQSVPRWVNRLALWQYLLAVGNFAGIVISLLLGYFGGGEYLEAPIPFKIGLLIVLILWLTNLAAIYFSSPGHGQTTSLALVTTVGVVASIILLIPNIIPARHPIVFNALRFLVVHLWEEGSIELIASGIFAALLATVMRVPWEKLEPWLLVEGALILISGALATAHHYYWLGVGYLWTISGFIFSALQLVPVAIMAYVTYHHSRAHHAKGPIHPTIACLWSAAFWNVLGVGALGFFMAIPQVNRYTHGTYMTSAHAHMAVFGLLGFTVLAGCLHSLGHDDNIWQRRRLRAILALNAGLGVMGGALFFAGVVQSYALYAANMPFTQMLTLLRPYFVVRLLGGLAFALGGVGLAMATLAPSFLTWWAERRTRA